jgi:hypothetical protein
LADIYYELLVTAKSDITVANILLENNIIIHCLFYLSQAFEKANKSLLAIIKQKYLGEDEQATEDYLPKRIAHDKGRATKEIIEFFRKNGHGTDFDQIRNELQQFKPYKHFTSIKEFHSRVNEDFSIYSTFNKSPDVKSSILHCKYHESKFYKYQTVCYILRRYYNDIETNIRYPTAGNNFSIKNPFNQQSSKGALQKLSLMCQDLIEVVSSISTELLSPQKQ